MNILLVTPWDKKHGSYRSLFSPFISYKALTLPTLAALVPPELHARVDVCDEMTDSPWNYTRHYDIVAFSIVSCESHRAYQLAARYKRLGCHIVFGGYHMLYNSEEGLRYADTVVVGPAEVSWPRFLRDFAAGRPGRLYRQPCFSPGAYAAPKREVLSRRRYAPVHTLMANPTCRRNCSFCVICKMWSAPPRPIPAVLREIRRGKGRFTIFFDPNFFGDRAYALRLMKAMCALRVTWAGAACIDVAEDDELLYWAKKSGCTALLLGLESMTPAALKASRKGFNRPAEYKAAIAKLQGCGFSINGCFVLGMDGDTERALRLLPYWVDYLGMNLAHFALLTPMPGAPLFGRLKAEGRIRTEDWRLYTQNQVVYAPRGIEAEVLKEIYENVWKKTYSWPAVLRRVRRVPVHSPREKALVLFGNIGFKFLGKDM